ncbi:MAG: TonB family protein [Gammaproteobacteria bacterium]
MSSTAYRTLITEIDVRTSEDEPTEWSEETRAEFASGPADADAGAAPDEMTNFVDEDESSAPESAADAVGPGVLLRNRYLLQRKIGTGSMGDVYKALDRDKEAAGSADPWVAIKVVSRRFSQNPNALEALKQEAEHGERLVHPNIIRVFDFDWDGDRFFMTMEWLEGESLVGVLNGRRFRPLPADQANSIIQGLCHGLGHAHAHGIAHADVKPGNIFITRAGHTKLLDFGIARITRDGPGNFDPTSIGAHTPAYSSCEVLEGQAAEACDDVYSLACVAYRLLAGRRAYGGATALEAEAGQVELQRISGLGDAQWRALKGALAWRRAHRTPDVAAFLAEFSGQSRPADVRSPAPHDPAATDTGDARDQRMPLKYGLPALAATLTAIALALWWPDRVERDAAQPVPPEPVTTPAPADTAAKVAADIPVAEPDVVVGRVDTLPAPLTAESVAAKPSAALLAPNPAPEPAPETERQRTADASPEEDRDTVARIAVPPAEIRDKPDSAAPAPRDSEDAEAAHFELILATVNRRMDDGHLVEPPNDSARDFIAELEIIAPRSPELQQARLRLANLMLLEAMVAITDEDFPVAENWIEQTRSLGAPDATISRYESELREARATKLERENERLSAIFASATPAAILAEPPVSFETPAAQQTQEAAAAARPDDPSPGGETAGLPVVQAEPELTPFSQLEFRRFVKPKPPRGPSARNKFGWVDVRFRVDSRGKTAEVRVIESEPGKLFEQAALTAVNKWRFKPYLVEGKATAVESGVRLRFEK